MTPEGSVPDGRPFRMPRLGLPPARQLVRRVAVLALAFGVLYGVGTFLPEGFDWIHFYSIGRFPGFWVPWSKYVIGPVNLPAIFALTILGITLRTRRYSASAIPVGLALVSLPTLWTLFLGTVDGLVLIGMITLPIGVPLVLLKPQLASFSLLARRRWIVAAVVWLLVSLLVWGFWPLGFREVLAPDWRQEWAQDISLFPWGLLLALPMLWFSRGDEDLLMAAGSFATPHLFPYHFIVLMPALARMKTPWMVLTWILSWTPLLANWLGPNAWHFGNLVGLAFWLGLRYGARHVPAGAAPVAQPAANPSLTVRRG